MDCRDIELEAEDAADAAADAEADADGNFDEDMVGILSKVMGLLKKERFGCFGDEAKRAFGFIMELGSLAVNNLNDDEIEEDDDMFGSQDLSKKRIQRDTLGQIQR